MITGYNHNIPHNGRTYHIQTEDSGLQHPHIITHLFVGGNIIHSKKRSYAHLLEEGLHNDEDAFEKKIREMMKAQHKEMLKELKGGKHDHVGTRKAAGALLTPGLLALSDSDADDSSVAPKASTPPPLGSLEPIEPAEAIEEAPAVPELALNTEDLVPPPVADLPEEDTPSMTSSVRKGGMRARGRMGRSRPQFKAPPPTKIPESKPSGTMPDMVPFSTDAEEAASPKRKLRSQRGSGRGKRPELQLQPPSTRFTPPPASVSVEHEDAMKTVLDLPLGELQARIRASQAEAEASSSPVREVIERWLTAGRNDTPIPPAHEPSHRWGVDAEATGHVEHAALVSANSAGGPVHQAALDYLNKNR